AERGRAELPAALRAAGATCDDVPIYRTVCPPSLPDRFLRAFDAGELDWITFTSPSTFHHLLQLLGPERWSGLSRVRLASIGPVTSRAMTAAGFRVDAEADPHDSAGLAAAIRLACGR